MRKWIALLLVLAMGLALFTGCGSKEPAATEAPAASNGGSAEPAASGAQETVTVKVSYPCLVVVPSPDATVAVEEAINNHLAEIGSRIRMKLDPIDGMSYATTIDMQQIGGEEVDLYMALGNLSDMVNSNKVLLQSPASIAAAAWRTCSMKEHPPTEVPSTQVGLMPR